MTMYCYNQESLKENGKTFIHLVTYLQNKSEQKRAELLIPEIFLEEDKADKRVNDIEDANEKVTADKYTLSLSPIGDSGDTTDLYLVMFATTPEDEDPSFMTPETFVREKAAKERADGTTRRQDSEIKARYFQIRLDAKTPKGEQTRLGQRLA